MNYENSNNIFQKLKNSNNVLMMCHKGPDLDCVLSCLVMRRVLKTLGIKSDIYSLEKLGSRNQIVDKKNLIKVVDKKDIDFGQYDLLVALDVNEIHRFGLGDGDFKQEIIFIDHHEGQIENHEHIIDPLSGSTCTIIYKLFRDCGIELTNNDLDDLLLGLVSDTGVFQFFLPSSDYFDIVSELIDSGADYQKALFVADHSNHLKMFEFWSYAIDNIEIDSKHRFAHTFIPYKVFRRYSKHGLRSRDISDNIIRKIKGTDFGVVMIEGEDGGVQVSPRTRTPGFYVLEFVEELGGGGHLTGGGAYIKKDSVEESKKFILKRAREFSINMRKSIAKNNHGH